MLRAEALLWLSSCLCVTVFCDRRLISGEDTTIEQYPYMAGFERWNWFECGSTIIHKTWALTAGNCVTGKEDAEKVWLRVGTTYRSSGGWTVPVYRAFKHDDTDAYDIALLFMERDIPLGDTVKIVRLPDQGHDVDVGTAGTIVGWGYMGQSVNSWSTMKRVEVTVLKREDCPPGCTDAFLCGRPKEGSDACRFDSGGPLVVGDMQVGIIRHGMCTGKDGSHIKMTNVGYFRRSMENTMQYPPVVPS